MQRRGPACRRCTLPVVCPTTLCRALPSTRSAASPTGPSAQQPVRDLRRTSATAFSATTSARSVPGTSALRSARAGRAACPCGSYRAAAVGGLRAGEPWLDEQLFGKFRRSPVRRAKRSGMLRNVCIALGNWGDPSALLALRSALHDSAALARGHAAWALGRIVALHGHDGAASALADALERESDEWVRSEIAAALA